MLKVLIVDDEPLARENLRILLETQPDIEIVGECGNAVEAIGAVHKRSGDGRHARSAASALYRLPYRV